MRYRTFLEPAKNNVDSYVAVDIDEEDGWIDLKIADCHDTINLSFGRPSSKNKRTYLKKLERLEKALALIREAIE